MPLCGERRPAPRRGLGGEYERGPLRAPRERDARADARARAVARVLGVLRDDDHAGVRGDLDHVVRHGAHVDGLDDRALDADPAVARRAERQLLRADREAHLAAGGDVRRDRRRQRDARGQPHAVALGRRVEQVRDADELGDERVGRALVDVLGVADLLELTLVHDRDRVRHRERLLLVVGHVDERDPDLALDVLQLELHRLAQLQVERAERLVEQQHRGEVDEGARERDALTLAARELARLGLRVVREAHALQHLPHAARDLGLGDLLAAKAEGDVLEQRRVLKAQISIVV